MRLLFLGERARMSVRRYGEGRPIGEGCCIRGSGRGGGGRRLTVGMEDWRLEFHLGREVRVVCWKGKPCAEEATCRVQRESVTSRPT